jgi:6-phosphogluconolactonase
MRSDSSVEIFPDPATLFRVAAEKIAAIAHAAVATRGRFFIALAGGNTPRELYLLLARDEWRHQVPWANTHIFFGDERCVPPDHPDSNYGMAKKALLDRLALPASQVHRMSSEQEPLAAAAAYEQEIRRVLESAGNELPLFDLILLGLGNDGHTASLFPGTAALHEKEKLVAANYAEKFKSHRLTLTLPVLNNAHHVMFLISGESKANIVHEILQAPQRSFQYPAELVQPEPGKLWWLLDRAAAMKLNPAAV